VKQSGMKKNFVFSRREPDLPSSVTPMVGGAELFQPYDVYIADTVLEEGRAENMKSGTLRIESSMFNNFVLANNSFGSIRCKDVRFAGCDFANLETRGLSLIRVEFISCRMTGFRADEADCQDLLIREGDQRYSQFRFGKFKSAEFDSCNFTEADFYGSDLSGSLFKRCNLRSAEMNKVKLLNADLRGSLIEGLQLNAEDIRGAVVDPSQAMMLALLLKIRIE
jgi:uncharacterized protein YjbI with pentapeptide repeats